MALTVGEVLENAEHNIKDAVFYLQIELGKEQLENYRIAKELGADDDDCWHEWKEKVENYKKEKGE